MSTVVLAAFTSCEEEQQFTNEKLDAKRVEVQVLNDQLAKTATGYNFSTYFLLLIAACVLAIFFMGLTFKEEQYLVADRKGEHIEEKK